MQIHHRVLIIEQSRIKNSLPTQHIVECSMIFRSTYIFEDSNRQKSISIDWHFINVIPFINVHGETSRLHIDHLIAI